LTALFLLSLTGSADGPIAADIGVKTRPGEFVIDHPTLINLGFEWVIDGDDNRNAQVDVSYRKQGDTRWKQGLALLRLQGERIYQTDGVFDVISPNMFAGASWISIPIRSTRRDLSCPTRTASLATPAKPSRRP
jgi:hypothetical protein